jgi:mRNA interferase MazF
MSIKKGDILLVDFPFTDLSQTKLRPALVLWVDAIGDDVTLCFISSQDITNLSPEEFILDPSDPEFQNTGLRTISKVRVTRVVTLERRLIKRRLGQLGINQTQQLNSVILQAFKLR